MKSERKMDRGRVKWSADNMEGEKSPTRCFSNEENKWKRREGLEVAGSGEEKPMVFTIIFWKMPSPTSSALELRPLHKKE